LRPQTVDGLVFGFALHFERERLHGYGLSIVDPPKKLVPSIGTDEFFELR
jgi:hypothetical protein